MKKRKASITEINDGEGLDVSHSKSERYATVIVFALIILIYAITHLQQYPRLMITTRKADTIANYDKYYPPFRTDEYNYYSISRNILSGDLYKEDSFERAYPLGFPLVAAPFVAIFGERGGYIANLVLCVLSAWLFFLLIRRYNTRIGVLALVLACAFATLNWFYAISNYSEPLAQVLIVTSLYLVMRGREGKDLTRDMVLAGVCLALTLFVRPHYIVLAIPFTIGMWYRGGRSFSVRNDGIAFALGVGSIVLLWMVRNAAVFGSPLSFEYTRMLASFTPGAEGNFLKGNVFTGTHRLLFDEFHGLLTITPIVLLFPAGVRAMWKKGMKPEASMLMAGAVIMILLFASGPYPFTEFGLGSRHMMPMFPVLLFPAVFFLDSTVFTRSIVAVCALYSFYHAGIGWFTGTYPGFGIFPAFLHDSHARAVILSRKGELPQRSYSSSQELLKAHRKALNKADMYTFLQTLHPEVRRKIVGNERDFMLFWKFRQQMISQKVKKADPDSGIVYEDFHFAPQPQQQETGQPQVTDPSSTEQQ